MLRDTWEISLNIKIYEKYTHTMWKDYDENI